MVYFLFLLEVETYNCYLQYQNKQKIQNEYYSNLLGDFSYLTFQIQYVFLNVDFKMLEYTIVDTDRNNIISKSIEALKV